MRALSLRSPWCRAILRWGKDVENRDWKAIPLDPPRQVLLHSSLWWNPDDINDIVKWLHGEGMIPEEGKITLRQFQERLGGIVGRVNIVGAQRNGAPSSKASRWADDDAVGLLLAEPVEAPAFVPWPGELGFFHVDGAAYRGALAFAKENPGAPREAFHRFWPEHLRPKPKATKALMQPKQTAQASLFERGGR